MTTTVYACGHEVNGFFITNRCNRNDGTIKENYSMGKVTKHFVCPQCEANLKLAKSAKDLPEKDKANQSNSTR